MLCRSAAGRRRCVPCARQLAFLFLLLTTLAFASPRDQGISKPGLSNELSSFVVPKLAAAPRLADFEGMEPATAPAKAMLKVSGFKQRDPKDGAPVTERTEAYLAYTDKNFYVIFLAFD